MAECDYQADEAPEAPAIFKLPAGTLNPQINAVDLNQRSIDLQQEGVYSVLGQAVDKAFTPNKFKGLGPLNAILLRIENPYGEGASCTAEEVTANATHTGEKEPLTKYRVRIPEMCVATLPPPNNLEDPCDRDKLCIDAHILCEAKDREVMSIPVKLGQVVRVQFASGAGLTNLKYLGPVDSKGTAWEKLDGPHSPPADYGKRLEECKKIYPNRGAIGDQIGRNTNLWKTNSGRTPLISGIGIPDGPVIPGEIHKEWVVNLFKELKKEGKYKGLIWTGVCKNNGPGDNLNMLTSAGKKSAVGSPGRSTVIYMPIGTDPTLPLEIIYWFHDESGFKNQKEEWNKLWNSLGGMIKKKKSLNNTRRNFILVVPEMLWSEQNTPATGIPRNETTPISIAMNQKKFDTASGKVAQALQRYAGYTDRQWAAWGFTGARISPPGYTGGMELPLPLSFRPLKAGPTGTTLTAATAGNMKLLHEEIIKLLQKYFNVTNKDNAAKITLVADHRGGIAISNLARLGQLEELNPSKIVLIHADYSSIGILDWNDSLNITDASTPDTNSKIYNYFHDNDAYEILKHINKDTQLEIHVERGAGINPLPRQAAQSFLGALATLPTLVYPSGGGNPTFQYAVQKLKDYYTSSNLDVGYAAITVDGEPAANQPTKNPSLLNGYKAGHSLLNFGPANKVVRMKPPFDNIICKSWGVGTAIGALAWLPGDQSTSTPAVLQPAPKTTGTFDIEDGVPNDVREAFRKFAGKAILYRSELVGNSKNVAILEPIGASAYDEYELIYYLHGDIGQNGAAKTFTPALENQFATMIGNERNVIIVLMDLGNNPSTSPLWQSGQFNQFHDEVKSKIKEKWSIGKTVLDDGSTSYDVPTRPGPEFFTIKANSHGSHILKNIIKSLANSFVAYTGGLRRIDLFDANWGPEIGIIKQITESLVWKAQAQLGTNFEIQMVVTSTAIGKPGQLKDSAKERATIYESTPGVWVIPSSVDHSALPYAYFSAPSKLSTGIPKIPVPNAPDALPSTPPGMKPKAPIPLLYNKEGHAYAKDGPPYYGKRLPQYDMQLLGFPKGRLKDHTPSTEGVGKIEACLVGSRRVVQTPQGQKNNTTKTSANTQDCKTNPLGLADYKTSEFTSIVIEPTKRNFSWGAKEFGKYLKGLDASMWARTSPATKWIIKDLSPKNANGVDKVGGHVSHREGIDADFNLPKIDTTGEAPIPVGTTTSEILKAQELDVDKMLAFIILSKLHGAKVFFLDKKFFKPLRERANFIATDGAAATTKGKTLVIDDAFKSFFREHLYEKPKMVKEIMNSLIHKPGHQNRVHVRIQRKWGSHETRDYPGWAIRRLKKMGCNYKEL